MAVSAPATKLLAIYCCACGRELTDAESAERALGPDCAQTLGYNINSIAPALRTEANYIVHAIAGDTFTAQELRGAIFRLFEMGFTSLAKRIEQRMGRKIARAYVSEGGAAQENDFIAPVPAKLDLPFTLTEGQERAREAVQRIMKVRGHAMCVVRGYAGTGKAQPLTSVVYTPSGPRKMGELRVGDWVCTPDGGRARVEGVFPQGKRNVWRFTLEDGVTVESCDEHLWVVKDRTYSSNLVARKTDIRRLSTAFIVDAVTNRVRGNERFYLQNCEALDFDSVQLPIDPYLLGLFLGNGLLHNNFGLSFARRSPLIEAAKKLLSPWNQTLRYRGKAVYTVKAIPAFARKHLPLRKVFTALGLWGSLSYTKFVPAVYWYSDKKQRLALLQGLLDTDGTVGKDGAVSYSTSSVKLADAVVWLARSLGARTAVGVKKSPKYVYKGEKLTGRPSYTIHIQHPQTGTLFRLKRKQARTRLRAWPKINRAIRKVEWIGELPVQCILIAHPDHQYVTDGVVRTHNTTALKVFASEYGTPQIVTPTGKAALRVREATGLTASTIHRWLYTPKEDEKTGAIKFVRRLPEDVPIPRSRLVLLDEASMVGPDVWKDVYETCRALDLKLVCVGDGFQLPPVQAPNAPPFSVLTDAFAQTLGAEMVEMTEVLRQAQGSPVIRASMELRNGGGLRSLRELPRVELNQIAGVTTSVHQQGGVTICHRNTTRFQLNAGIRGTLGIFDEMPQVGEPMMVLKNTYEAGVMNGETFNFEGWGKGLDGEVLAPSVFERVYDRWKQAEEDTRFGASSLGKLRITLSLEELHGRLTVGPKAIQLGANRWARLNNLYSGDALAPHVHANFGYAWTAHKSQGSQWPFVLMVVEPSVRLDEDDGRRWVYTAVTRATEMTAYFVGRLG